MAKICVLTFANAVDNYGQVLQYLATQEYLKERGHEPYLLVPKGHRRSILQKVLSRFRKMLHAQPHRTFGSELERKQCLEFGKWWQVMEQMEKEHPRHFEVFRRENFRMLRTTYEQAAEMNFDVYAIGSDQTWATSNEDYYLAWLPKSAKRFAIAPSVAHYQFTEADVQKLSPCLKQFGFITVRESNGLALCQKVGYEGAVQILDPTFLIPSAAYDRYSVSVSGAKPYLFLYLLGGEISVDVSEIFSFAEKKGLEVRYVASQGRTDSYPKCYAEVGEWLGLLKGAEYVITNSFHGMAFSIIYRKQFMVMPLVGVFQGMNVRVMDLADRFGLNDRIYKNDLNEVERPADWSVVDEEITSNKKVLDKLMLRVQL